MKMLRICNCWVRPEAVEAVQDTKEGCYPSPRRVTIVTLRSGIELKFSDWLSEEICKKLEALEGEK